MSLPQRPKQLANAIKILSVWVMVVFIIELAQFFIQGVPHLVSNPSENILTAHTYIFMLSVILLIQYLFLFGLWRAKNWVRLTYLVLFSIGLLAFLYSLALGPTINAATFIPLLLSTISWILNFYLVIQLFNQESSNWYRSVKLK